MQQTDEISPTHIEHAVDEVWNDGKLEQFYNYLDYHFANADAYMRARVYLDEPRTALLYGPFAARQSIASVSAPKLRELVEAYLGRRFQRIADR